MDISSSLKEEVTPSLALSKSCDLSKLIFADTKPHFKKSNQSLIREFDNDKWGKMLKLFKNCSNRKLEYLEKIEDGEEDKFVFYKNKYYRVDPSFLRKYIKSLLIKSVKRLSNIESIDHIVELGSGYGSKLLSIALSSRKLSKKKYIALDISNSALELINSLFNEKNINLQTKLFNYRDELITSLKLPNPSLLITSYGLHYKKEFTLLDIKNFISSGFVAGIHFEPCSDLIENLNNKLYSSLSIKYMIYNDYTLNISSPFIKAHEERLINLKISSQCLGVGLLPGNLITWSVKKR